MLEKFDLVVIGSGPGGYVCAIRAAQLGKKVAIIEKQHLGGICLNWGCIPTKALLRSAEIFHYISNSESFGISTSGYKADMKKIVERSRKVAEKLSSGVKSLLKKNKVQIFDGTASFVNNTKIKVKSSSAETFIEAKNFVIATGARARILKNFEPDGNLVLTYKEAMIPDNMPKSIVIVGSGAIGVEFASFYSSLGSKVTILESRDKILPVEDSEISNFARKSFEKSGIKIFTSVTLDSLHKSSDSVTIKFQNKGKIEEVTADKLIMAVGIVPNTEELDLKNTKIELEKNGHIKTDQYLQTSEKNIYAIGDVTAGPWLAHKASHEGVLVAEKICDIKVKAIKSKLIPGCTYSMPQIASVGITEDYAKENKIEVKIGKFPFVGNGKAIALGESEGLIKTIFDAKTGEILGAHLIGAEVTELINSFVLAMNLEATEEDLFHTIFPHPTLSEMIHESAMQAFSRAIHI